MSHNQQARTLSVEMFLHLEWKILFSSQWVCKCHGAYWAKACEIKFPQGRSNNEHIKPKDELMDSLRSSILHEDTTRVLRFRLLIEDVSLEIKLDRCSYNNLPAYKTFCSAHLSHHSFPLENRSSLPSQAHFRSSYVVQSSSHRAPFVSSWLSPLAADPDTFGYTPLAGERKDSWAEDSGRKWIGDRLSGIHRRPLRAVDEPQGQGSQSTR